MASRKATASHRVRSGENTSALWGRGLEKPEEFHTYFVIPHGEQNGHYGRRMANKWGVATPPLWGFLIPQTTQLRSNDNVPLKRTLSGFRRERKCVPTHPSIDKMKFSGAC